MALRYIVKAKIGEYKDKQSGEMKSEYVDIGVIMDGQNGFVMKLKTIPVGNWDGFAFLSEPQQRSQGGGRRPTSQRRQEADPDDDIPF